MTARRLAVGACVLAVLATTLTPAGYVANATPATCLFCGDRGAADALSNVLLFVPLGLALSLAGAGRAALVGGALALSLVIEGLQLTVISRYASLGDVVWNAAGAALGLVLHRWWPRLRPQPADGPARALAAAAACVALVAVVGVLLRPAPPGGTWYIHWLRNLARTERYRGRIVDATVGGQRLAPWREFHPDQARAALLARGPVRLDVEVGPPPHSLAALLTVLGAGREEIVYLGAIGEDVVVREYRLASALKFHTPERRVAHVLSGLQPGDTVQLVLEGSGGGRCLTLGAVHQCGLDVPLSRAWTLVAGLDGLPAPLRATADVVWMLALFAPLGLWSARRYLPVGAALALGGALLLVPVVTRTVFVSWGFAVVALLGVAAGAWGRGRLTSRSPQTA